MSSKLLLVFIIGCFISAAAAINCYICNSLMDSRCEEDYKSFLKVCPVKSFGGQRGVKAIGCRVVRQSIENEHSVIRECAYSGEDVVGKATRGSANVKRVYTQCSDKPGCNSAQTMTMFVAFVIAVIKMY